MLTLPRDVLDKLEPENCIIIDLPDGTRVRLWVVPNGRTPSTHRLKLVFDAPADVILSRGELLAPEHSASPVKAKHSPARRE